MTHSSRRFVATNTNLFSWPYIYLCTQHTLCTVAHYLHSAAYFALKQAAKRIVCTILNSLHNTKQFAQYCLLCTLLTNFRQRRLDLPQRDIWSVLSDQQLVKLGYKYKCMILHWSLGRGRKKHGLWQHQHKLGQISIALIALIVHFLSLLRNYGAYRPDFQA